MMERTQEVEEMKEWTDVYENTLTEDTDSIVVDGLDCTEVEAYIINSNTRDTPQTFYLTSMPNGNIYGEPRATKIGTKAQYIMRLSLKRIKPYLWEKRACCIPYIGGSNYAADDITYQNSANSTTLLNHEKISGVTLIPQSGKLEAGCKIYIRVRQRG